MMGTTLIDDVGEYCDFAGIQKVTADGYRCSVRCFSDFLGRLAIRSDLTEPIVNRWLGHVAQSYAAKTVLNRKRGITPVWNWLADRGIVKHYNPRKLRRIRVDIQPVRAWSIADVRILLDAAAYMPGRLRCGVRASDLMSAWIRVAYETGFRPSDLRIIEWSHFIDDRTLAIQQHKTRKPVAKRLSDDSVQSLGKLKGCSPRVFILTKGGIRRWELLLFKRAERLGFRRSRGQATGTLRKTHGTEVCRVSDAQQAALSLGHVSGPAVALQSYIAPDAIGVMDTPPELIDGLARPAPNRQDHRKRVAKCG